MSERTAIFCPAPNTERDPRGESPAPVRALTHDEQIAEYVRLVEEARMRT